jgi:hypothetical protein
MLQPFESIEDAKAGLLVRLRELALHPSINVRPEQVHIDTSSRYRRVMACCRRRNTLKDGKTWTIIFNLHALRANLNNVEELEHTCQHEIAHIPAPNHGPQFYRVCRSLGMPENRIGAKTSRLIRPVSVEIFVCLRCGSKKHTLREHTNKLKLCDYCGLHWDQALARMDKSRTMAMFPVKEAGSISELAVPHGDRHLKTRWLPWKEYAQYLREGGTMTVVSWWGVALRDGIYTIPEKYIGKGLTPDCPTMLFGESFAHGATALKQAKDT